MLTAQFQETAELQGGPGQAAEVGHEVDAHLTGADLLHEAGETEPYLT